jgi:hypothetical protein
MPNLNYKKLSLILGAILIGIILLTPLYLKNLNKDETAFTHNHSKMAMVLSYAEAGKDKTDYLLRVSIEKDSTDIPTKLEILSDKGDVIKEFPLTLATKSYPCMNAEDDKRDMPGYETGMFNIKGWIPETGKVRIQFKDNSGSMHSMNYEISHYCTVIKDTGKNDLPSSDDNLPPE